MDKISWQALEYHFTEKSQDWYWALGIVAVAIAIASILYDNILFAVLILVGAFALAIYAGRRPEIITVETNKKGVVVNDTLYPFASLESFWVEENDNKLLLKSKKTLMPLIAIPLGDTNPKNLRSFLLELLTEEEHHEPASQKLMEHLGF